MTTTVEVLAAAFKDAGTPFIVGHPGGESVELMEAARQRQQGEQEQEIVAVLQANPRFDGGMPPALPAAQCQGNDEQGKDQPQQRGETIQDGKRIQDHRLVARDSVAVGRGQFSHRSGPLL